MSPNPKLPRGRPPRTAGECMTQLRVRLGSEDRSNLAIVRHLLGAPDDSEAVRRALTWAALDAGERLTEEQRAKILAGA